MTTLQQAEEMVTRLRAKRDAAMRRLHRDGWSLARIGRRFGLTRERVRQIVTPPTVSGEKPR